MMKRHQELTGNGKRMPCMACRPLTPSMSKVDLAACRETLAAHKKIISGEVEGRSIRGGARRYQRRFTYEEVDGQLVEVEAPEVEQSTPGLATRMAPGQHRYGLWSGESLPQLRGIEEHDGTMTQGGISTAVCTSETDDFGSFATSRASAIQYQICGDPEASLFLDELLTCSGCWDARALQAMRL